MALKEGRERGTKEEAVSLIRLNGLPFRLATTSFIYPDRMAPNVRKLGPYFDEIELLIFESRPFVQNGIACDVLPASDEIKELIDLAHEFNLSYNIHLPVDISMTDPLKSERSLAVDTVKRVMDLCAPLCPSTHTLHLDFSKDELWGTFGRDENDVLLAENYPQIQQWRGRAQESLMMLASTLDDPATLSIETLHYPFELLDGIIDGCGMSVCVDAGHLMKYGYDIHWIFERYGDRIPLIHLHGVDFSHVAADEPQFTAKEMPFEKKMPKDHKGLDRTPPEKLSAILSVLKQYNGTVSLEVFKAEDLVASLKYLHRIQSMGFELS